MKTTKLAAVPRMASMVAPVVFYEPNNDDWLESHATRLLVPTRRASGISIMDNLSRHSGAPMMEKIEAV